MAVQSASGLKHYPSFATSQNTGTVVSPSPETVVRTAVMTPPNDRLFIN